MGLNCSKEIDQISAATSNTSLSTLRYVITEKPKWKVFKKREITAVPAYHTAFKPTRGCLCGNDSPCKQKVSPMGVVLHYPKPKKKPNKLKTLSGMKQKKSEKGYLSASPRPAVQMYRPKKFTTWRLDKIAVSPYLKPFKTAKVPILIKNP